MRFSEKTKQRVKRLYLKKQCSIAEISRTDGCPTDPKTIRTWLLDMGVELRTTNRQYPRQKILEEWKAKTKDIKVSKKKLKKNQTVEGVRRSIKAKIRRSLQDKYRCSPKYLSNLIRGEIKP